MAAKDPLRLQQWAGVLGAPCATCCPTMAMRRCLLLPRSCPITFIKGTHKQGASGQQSSYRHAAQAPGAGGVPAERCSCGEALHRALAESKAEPLEGSRLTPLACPDLQVEERLACSSSGGRQLIDPQGERGCSGCKGWTQWSCRCLAPACRHRLVCCQEAAFLRCCHSCLPFRHCRSSDAMGAATTAVC